MKHKRKIRFGRLLKCARHLESGKLGHEVFDYGRFNRKADGSRHIEPTCGFAGCMGGELPIVFPTAWRFGCNGIPRFKSGSAFETDAMEFFGLTLEQARHLFFPWEQRPRRFGGKILGAKSSREEVAANFRAFVKKMKPTPKKARDGKN